MKFLIAAFLVLILGPAAHARVITETVDYKDGDTVLEGYLAYDDSIYGKRPGVVVVHEWWGINDYVRGRAKQLAQLGYVAFAVDMYGKGVLAKTPQEAGALAGKLRDDRRLMRSRVAAGLEVLRKQRLTDSGHIAAIGYCFGGTTVLELARGGSDVAGVVSFHGGLATSAPAAKGAVKARVLVLHGADDPFVPPAEVAAFQDEMRTAGVDWQMVYYSGAVHSFTNPEVDAVGLNGAKYNAQADRRSWEAMRQFFGEIFGARPTR